MIYYHIIILLLIVFVLKLDAGKVNKKEILKGDLPFISCAVCNRVVHEAYALVYLIFNILFIYLYNIYIYILFNIILYDINK